MRHINRYPRQGMRLTLMLLPFVLMIAAWFIGSAVRLEANPQDKLLPGLSQMIAAIDRMAFTPDKRSGEYLLWADTLISMSRLLIGLALSSLIGLGIGIACYGCCVATARQPELQGRLFTNFIIGAALAEALGLIGFVLTFIV